MEPGIKKKARERDMCFEKKLQMS